ncbi:hypothetical protein [Pseudodesulfovibrio senegalensis]|uniref:Uncharacterized protein n=1 Tax=Pseudodesulfovibrio senegalensis TaxID=1721087 RepID=A0A6N6N4Z0_9BACT|nr:hypothetical protein [Pseudodesulfovibrio senegalensis]KAB1442848.1 hypothetical protein F8A88_00805 [Pseudodesulfovibrio senegalensis]
MIANKKEFTGGVALLVLFFVVLYAMFQPMFDGRNAMGYLDHLYNTISKGSVYYIPDIKSDVEGLKGQDIAFSLGYGTEIEATQSQSLFREAGAMVERQGKTLNVKGALSAMLGAALSDADLMYNNHGAALTDKYDVEPRRALFNWWTSLGLMDKELKKQGRFAASKVTSTVLNKGVEMSYNYYEIEPVQIMDELGMVIFSLAFYVIYTLWYGFAILFVFEGWGLRLSH